ncbi:hypothetical protein IGI04_042559 [Brassica rapa subsp. trilocularis]|uniref:Retrotransposon gag domain-containing protein n=1 Tax=Brassica rapa subsp. trilocularis TaxID=1813537 RepID=A0ABQ7KJ09_BRACM|nr:hypothetical protein IGI04_042559 [Brassica rapa subsp. trilocularis]
MSHLSLSKDVKTGPEIQKDTNSTSLLRSKVVHDLSPRDKEILNPKEEAPSSQGIKEHEFKGEEPPGTTPVMNQEKVQDTMQSMLLKEAKPVNKVSNQGKCQTPPRETGIDVCVLDVESKNESYLLPEVLRKEPDHKPSHEPPHKWKSSVEQCVQMPRLKVIFSDLKTSKTLDYPDIMHLSLPKSFDPGIKEVEVHNHQGQKMQRRQQTRTSCPKKKIILQLVEAIKNVENFSGCKGESFKEIPPDNLLLLGESKPKMVRTEPTRSMKDHPLKEIRNAKVKSRGVILSYLLKEEPPDAQSIPKPKQYQGYTVSRSKPFQGGGNVAASNSAAEPEVDPTPYSTSQGANQDIRALKMPYLTNQEGLNHEANFYAFYTQEGVQANWNWVKIITEREVMNFTIQRFLNPSICEYPTLEEDSSSMKGRPEAKPITEVKRSLSSFHKAQDQEKWPRKLGVMINSPEPAKPTSSMESLQPIQLGSTQSYLWEPGDHLNQSGGIPEVLSCTRTQEISWFNGESLKPNRSYLWKDWTIFRFDPFQAIPIQPGEPDDVQTEPRHPGDIIHEAEEFYNFIPCTSPHRNKKIPIITKLPYLESLAFKLQQLFFYQGKDEISFYKAFKKVPRKLSYPLKPSRFKQIKFLHLEPKSHKRLQRLVSDFLLSLDLFPFFSFVNVQNRPSPSPSRPSSHSIAVHPSCPEEMEELAQSQALLASQKQLLAAMKGVQDQISQLEKRNKAQGQRPQQGKRRFGDAPEDGYVEPNPPDPSWITPHHTSSTHKHLTHSYLYFKPVNEVKIYSFSGSSWPDDYLSWERTMDDWFSCHGVPKKEKLSHAIKQLNGSAYKWWKGVDGARWKSQREAIKTWEDLKEAMIRKYVSSLPTPEIRERYPRRFSSHGSKEAKRVVPQQGHRSFIHQEQIRPNQGHKVLYDQSQPYEVPKTMERKNFVSQDTLARHKEKSDKPIFQEKAKDVKTGPEIQKDTNSTSLLRSKVVHDLSPRDKEILNPKEEAPSSQGIKEHELKGEEPPGATPVMNQEKVQDTMQSMLLKEAKPVNKVSNQESKNESYLLPEVLRKEPDHKPSHEPPHKWKSSVEQCVQMPRLKVIFSDLKTSKTLDYPDIMHLSLPKSFDPGIKEVEVHNHQGQKMQRRQQTRTSCPKKKIILQLVEAIKNVENFSGCKGESFKDIPPDNLLLLGESKPKMVRTEPTRSMKDHPLKEIRNAKVKSRGVILSYLLKEEPPDAQSIPKPKQYQGYTVSRSKPFQGGGNVAASNSAAEPEVDPTPYSTSQGANQDIRALKMPYLTNQEGLNHEANFYAFYTQEGVQANWN